MPLFCKIRNKSKFDIRDLILVSLQYQCQNTIMYFFKKGLYLLNNSKV